MHDSVMAWVGKLPIAAFARDKDVLEVGALDVNGSVRQMVEAAGPRSYLATDMRPGPGVDKVIDAANLPESSADLVISTEMLEHAQNWIPALVGMRNALRDGGVLVLTTRGPGFGLHEHPGDYWRFTPAIIAQALVINLGMDLEWLQPDPDYPGLFAVARLWAGSDILEASWPAAMPME